MRKHTILIFFTMMLVISSSYVSAINVNIEKKTSEIRNKNFEHIYNIIFPENCSTNNKNIPLGQTFGSSTIFKPPYSNCHSWGEKTFGIDEYAHGGNKYSGAIGAYANAWIGGATAEAMQRLDFYVGKSKKVSICAEIVRSGGKITFGFGSFAGTEKTWTWDDFVQNYHRSDVDPWWSWDIIILKIINLISLLVGSNPQNISEAITALSNIFNFEDLKIQLQNMLDDEDAEILHINFSFTANPGYHKIWVGLRATASACITGTGSGVTMGQVSKITIDGIAAPESPTLSGISSGKVDKNYEFSIQSFDPNNDKIKYFIDWGDGTSMDWTDYKTSGSKVVVSHTYSKKGTYKIKAIVEDIDKMQSETEKIINISDMSSVLFATKNLKKIYNNFLFFFLTNIKRYFNY